MWTEVLKFPYCTCKLHISLWLPSRFHHLTQHISHRAIRHGKIKHPSEQIYLASPEQPGDTGVQ